VEVYYRRAISLTTSHSRPTNVQLMARVRAWAAPSPDSGLLPYVVPRSQKRLNEVALMQATSSQHLFHAIESSQHALLFEPAVAYHCTAHCPAVPHAMLHSEHRAIPLRVMPRCRRSPGLCREHAAHHGAVIKVQLRLPRTLTAGSLVKRRPRHA
jgi:hypothetical protein